MGSQYVDVVVFALVAVFIGLRLRSVLGRRTGNEPPPRQGFGFRRNVIPGDPPPATAPANSRPPAPIIEATATQVEPEPVAAGLARIRARDPSLTEESFTGGARAAFEMILHAFAEGDETALRPLLSDEVFQNFTNVIRARREAGETCENKLVQIAGAEIVEADMVGRVARITMRFASQQVICVKNAQGAVVEGDPAKTVQVVDLWTFARDPQARDPNWALVATRSQDE